MEIKTKNEIGTKIWKLNTKDSGHGIPILLETFINKIEIQITKKGTQEICFDHQNKSVSFEEDSYGDVRYFKSEGEAIHYLIKNKRVLDFE